MDDNERNNKIFLNGDIYIGDFKGLLPHGKGKYTWSDGTIYEGEWEEGKMTGKGQIHWPSGATYDGDFSGGYLHCFGTFTGVDGSVYRGVWRMNIQHGLGRKQYYNSDIYEGSWKEGVREGCGRYAWNDGDTYVGNWKAGKMSGRGVLKWANGDLFDGVWLDGLIHGSGFYRFADGGFYSGTWTRGLKDGRGKFYPAGSNLPSMPKCYNSISHCEKQVNETSYASSVTFEDFGVRRPSTKRSLSKKFFIGNIFRYSGQMSHRSMSTDAQCNLDGPARKVPLQDSQPTLISTSDDGEHEAQCSNLAYEREYVQGVLIKEKVRNNSVILSDKHNQRHKFQAREAKRRQGEKIFKGHRNYYLMLDLQLGIRYTVGKITPVPMREVRSSDFGPQARITMYFPSKGSQFTPPHKSISFHWKDYCPMVFRNLRDLFKLDAADYMMSICGDDGLRELSSPGKSGSIFYLSQDQKFVIKTLRRSELKILLKMLHKYYKHVRTYDNTMITKFFGLHRITLRGGKKVRFVVMGNMFCTELRIHRRYDLKGSSQGRSTDKHKINENTTLKDLDLSYVFRMDRSLRDSLFSQISVDCMFLESQCIMDYSLLLGLHFRAPEHLKFLLETPEALPNPDNSPDDEVRESSQRELLFPPKGLLLVTHDPQSVSNMRGAHIRGSTLRTSATGDEEADLLVPGTGRLRLQLGVNMPALANHKLLQEGFDSPEVELFEVYDVVLYLGIIDILQKYNIKKKIEHAFKSLQFDPLSISAVEPKQYSKRFINFLERVFPREP